MIEPENYETIYAQPAEPQPKIQYSRIEQIGAFLAMIAGFLFIRFTLHHEMGLFTTLSYWFLITTEMLFVKKSGMTFSTAEKIFIGSMYLFSTVYIFTANETMRTLTTIFLILNSGIFLLGVSTSLNTIFRFLPEALSLSVFAMPFADFGKCFEAVKQSKGNALWKNAWYIFGGLLIAFPLTCAVASLLCQADENMSAILGSFLKIPPEDLLIFIPEIAFGMLIGCAIYSAMYNSTHRGIILDGEESGRKAEQFRFIPNLMLYTAVTPIGLLYILYVISQLNYFMGGFLGKLAEGYTYAQYARKGFFELCVVCCINIALIAGMEFSAKVTGEKKPLLLKIYNIGLSLCSLFLAGTAIAKMFLYIHYYGMTRLRIYTTWFMILLVVGFMILIFRQFRYTLNIGKTAYIAFSILFGVLVFSRPDEWITRYNAQQYLSGNLPEFDTRVISEMSEDAWAAMASYSRNDLIKLYSSHQEKNINPEEIFEDVHEELEKDIYQKLNLSAWEIMYHGQ